MLTALGHSVSLDSVCGTGIQTVGKEILECGLELLGVTAWPPALTLY